MVEKGIQDIAVDMMKDRLHNAMAVLQERYKGVQPFRKRVIPDRELLYNYYQITPQERTLYQQSFGEAWNFYERKMEELRRKYNARY